jgi:hypothetical protein
VSEDVVELRIPQAARSATLGELRFYESSEHELGGPEDRLIRLFKEFWHNSKIIVHAPGLPGHVRYLVLFHCQERATNHFLKRRVQVSGGLVCVGFERLGLEAPLEPRPIADCGANISEYRNYCTPE